MKPLSVSVTLEPSPSSLQQDPRWTPLEDMEVFSPDEEDTTETQTNTGTGTNSSTGPSTGPPLSPSGEGENRNNHCYCLVYWLLSFIRM